MTHAAAWQRLRGSAAVVVTVLALMTLSITTAWAATLTLTSSHLGTATVTPFLFPTALVSMNNGTTAGKVQGGDSFTVTYSEQVQASTICSAASNSLSSQTLPGLTVQIVDNGASTSNDEMVYLVGSSPCSSMHIGTIDLGSPNYVTGGTVSFPSSSALLTQGTGSATVTVTLGTPSGGTLGAVAGSSLLYTPDPAITDKSSHSIGTNTVATSATTQF